MKLLILAGLAALAAWSGPAWSGTARAETAPVATYEDPAPYCAAVRTIDKPDARYAGPAVPDWMAQALKRTSHAAADAPLDFFKRAAWRCLNGRVLACLYGANIPCDEKADVGRKPGTGAVNFCRDNPDADLVPAVATGHATVYEWRCTGGKPTILRRVLKTDGRGYPRAFWHPVAPSKASQK